MDVYDRILGGGPNEPFTIVRRGTNAGVAQLAEQRTRNAQVRGSSPRSGSSPMLG
jgi:hypothetical protein